MGFSERLPRYSDGTITVPTNGTVHSHPCTTCEDGSQGRRRRRREACMGRVDTTQEANYPRRRTGEAKHRFMVFRWRWDVPAGRRFSHLSQGGACHEELLMWKSSWVEALRFNCS